ncbi:2-oxo-4-hydroxy-4-carboxy-5-ureidoimidazoline decarboxylase [Angustibacter sp. McL0619]|uniref:2-oxo-4-hydroxy-4-carboxy-5-ureidoimidazoline decarboxylase n=1 Tax=Angustibacter sp. McL0619 TaxID=3415676 RepID=UPI003CE84E9B
MSAVTAEHDLLACCSSPAWVRAMAAGRPFASVAEAQRVAAEAIDALDQTELSDALAGHPRIGERARAGQAAERSRREQAGMDEAAAATRASMAELNLAYEGRFGYVYLVCASGLSAEELLAQLRTRLTNDPATERAVMRQELAKITRLRLATMLAEDG